MLLRIVLLRYCKIVLLRIVKLYYCEIVTIIQFHNDTIAKRHNPDVSGQSHNHHNVIDPNPLSQTVGRFSPFRRRVSAANQHNNCQLKPAA